MPKELYTDLEYKALPKRQLTLETCQKYGYGIAYDGQSTWQVAPYYNQDGSLVGQMVSEGTTPRRLTDLIGSLCDLTSGSGDKGTPIVYIQGYFDNYASL